MGSSRSTAARRLKVRRRRRDERRLQEPIKPSDNASLEVWKNYLAEMVMFKERLNLDPPIEPDATAGKNEWKKYYWKRSRYNFKVNREEELKAASNHFKTRKLRKPDYPQIPPNRTEEQAKKTMARYEMEMEKYTRKMKERGYL